VRLDFLETGSPDCPLIRIYGNNPGVCQRLIQAMRQLADGNSDEFSVGDILGVQPAESCVVIAKVGKWDSGVARVGRSVFHWVLTKGSWENVGGLMQPFAERLDCGFQWLDQTACGSVRVLISADGRW
jgi:hypothetical protein